ncbi:MAG: GlxA family transcriptional regulator [Terriglobales bacterium]
MRIHVLVLNGAFDTGLAAVLDGFSTANGLAHTTGVASLRFEVRVAGLRRSVITAQGLRVPVLPASELDVPDCVVLPAIGQKAPGPLVEALESREVRDAAATLRRWSNGGALLASACIGTFVLAESSLLDGEEATTTWWLAPLFRQRYPRVRLDESRIIVNSNRVVTAGAALSHLDLALALIQRSSPELAALTARYLVVDSRPSQSIFAIPNHLVHSDPVVRHFERWARARLSRGFSLEDAARALRTSKRTLARRMRRVLGKTPLAYFQDLRIERAVHFLKTSTTSVDQIASQIGYANGVTLRSLLRRRLGRGVREIRGGA